MKGEGSYGKPPYPNLSHSYVQVNDQVFGLYTNKGVKAQLVFDKNKNYSA